eukprot:4492834-Lingulodinium_polyedra.AAC.1
MGRPAGFLWAWKRRGCRAGGGTTCRCASLPGAPGPTGRRGPQGTGAPQSQRGSARRPPREVEVATQPGDRGLAAL